jgi:hypothetical protein
VATPSGPLIYSLPTDNVVDAVIPTCSRAADPKYPVSNIYDKNPASWYWAGSTGDVRFVWDFGSAVNLSWATIVIPNIPAATAGVKLEGNSSNSWPGAVVVPFTIPTWAEDGFPWNPYVINASAVAYRYWSIYIPAIAVPLSLGEIAIFSNFREMLFNINWDADLAERHPVIEHKTDANAQTAYDRGVRWFELTGEVDSNDVERAAVRTWIRSAAGRTKPFFIIPETTSGTAVVPDNHAWMVKFKDTDLLQKLAFIDWTKLTIGWEELSRGLKP